MAEVLGDYAFNFLLRTMIPLVVAPLGGLPPRGVQLRGVVRVGDERVRMVLSEDAQMGPGVAVEFDLARGAGSTEVVPMMDHLRAVVAPRLGELMGTDQPVRDCHSNVVVQAKDTGFDGPAAAMHYDQEIFRLFTLLVNGGGIVAHDEDYTFGGFMFRSDHVCRIYIRVTETDLVYGFDAPIDGEHGPGTYGYNYLPLELAPLTRTGDLASKPVVDDADEYCTAVVDLSTWVGH
ncbi:hypothetical protein D5S18_32145 [Nocardia panacis]|uniref:Uncharacterized protein n=1 Tax=Nocardia panacis TaxID=2340916 RepID=A0A3A4KJD5_9NOCA|nr:hypothetical protein [Nocardia panacis]RJO69293.1 hypothetical protein D5S18_32145 [Nocardia panacis]